LMLEYTDWQTPAVEVLNVVGTITDLASAVWDQDLSTDEPMWKVAAKELHLPTLDFYGTIYKGVIVKGVVWTYEKDEA